MTQRISTVVALVAMALVGCGVGDSPLQIINFFSLDPTHSGACLLAASTFQGGGSLDIAGSSSYGIGATLRNSLDAALDTTAGTSILTAAKNRNQINLDQMQLTYVATPDIGVATETVPLAFLIAPAVDTPVTFGLLGPKAADALQKKLVSAGDKVDLRVKVQLAGAIVSGGRTNSLAVTYPITVFQSGFAGCAAGDTIARFGPCMTPSGQDGSRVCCVSDPTCKAQ